jgi:hypothetical protein
VTTPAAPRPPRSTARRKADVLEKLRRDVDLWVASADEGGNAHLVPLSFYWDGSALVIATPRSSRTAMNLMRSGWARVALGPTRDVVIIEGPVGELARGTDVRLEDAHASATGFDPRMESEDYVYLRVTPDSIQAWREADELAGRSLMRQGQWRE